MDGSGFSKNCADKYYASVIGNSYSRYTKCHITIDVESRIILHSQAVNGSRNDMAFAIGAARSTKKYKPTYVLA